VIYNDNKYDKVYDQTNHSFPEIPYYAKYKKAYICMKKFFLLLAKNVDKLYLKVIFYMYMAIYRNSI